MDTSNDAAIAVALAEPQSSVLESEQMEPLLEVDMQQTSCSDSSSSSSSSSSNDNAISDDNADDDDANAKRQKCVSDDHLSMHSDSTFGFSSDTSSVVAGRKACP